MWYLQTLLTARVTYNLLLFMSSYMSNQQLTLVMLISFKTTCFPWSFKSLYRARCATPKAPSPIFLILTYLSIAVVQTANAGEMSAGNRISITAVLSQNNQFKVIQENDTKIATRKLKRNNKKNKKLSRKSAFFEYFFVTIIHVNTNRIKQCI